MTDAEVADVKHSKTPLLNAWEYLTPDQKLAELIEQWTTIWAEERNDPRH